MQHRDSSPQVLTYLHYRHTRTSLACWSFVLFAVQMASESCCPAGSWPGLTEDSARALAGSVSTTASGLAVYYVAPPAPSSKGIVIAYDVHGFKGGRVKSVCDSIAAAGFHVVMPDVYGGGVDIDDLGGIGSDGGKALLVANNWTSLAPKFAEACALLTSHGATSIGAAGFCWGAWACVHLSGDAASPVKAIASCHPSIRIGPWIHGEDEATLVGALSGPMLLCCAQNEPDNVKPGGALIELARSKFATSRSNVYPEMQHGWSIRGDAFIPAVARDVKLAIDELTAFFTAEL